MKYHFPDPPIAPFIREGYYLIAYPIFSQSRPLSKCIAQHLHSGTDNLQGIPNVNISNLGIKLRNLGSIISQTPKWWYRLQDPCIVRNFDVLGIGQMLELLARDMTCVDSSIPH